MKKLTVFVLCLFALCIYGCTGCGSAFAEDVEPAPIPIVDETSATYWKDKYKDTKKELLETKLELNRITAAALNLQQDLLICNTFTAKVKQDRVENMTKASQNALNQFNKDLNKKEE